MHYFNAAVVCIGFTAYLLSDNILINDGRIMFLSGTHIHYLDGFKLRKRPITAAQTMDIIKASPTMDAEAIDVFKSISNGFPFVVYSNHTCVLLQEDAKGMDEEQLISDADNVLREYGKEVGGPNAGGIGMIKTKKNGKVDGYLVTCPSPDMLTFVSHQHEMQTQGNNQMDLDICLYGKRKRKLDGQTLQPIYWSNAVDENFLS